MSFRDACDVNGKVMEEIAKLKENVASLCQKAIRIPLKDDDFGGGRFTG